MASAGWNARPWSHPDRWKLVGLETLDGSVLPHGALAVTGGKTAKQAGRNRGARHLHLLFGHVEARHCHGAGAPRPRTGWERCWTLPGRITPASRRGSWTLFCMTRKGQSKMSDMATSALPGATYQGFVTVAEAGLRGMITLRGDLSALAGTVKKKKKSWAARSRRNGGWNKRAAQPWHGCHRMSC